MLFYNIFLLDAWLFQPAWLEGLLLFAITFILGYLIRRAIDKPKLENLQLRQQELENELVKSNEQNLNLQNNINALQGNITTIQTTLNNCQENNASLKKELAACKSSGNTMSKQIIDLKGQIATLSEPAQGTGKSTTKGKASTKGKTTTKGKTKSKAKPKGKTTSVKKLVDDKGKVGSGAKVLPVKLPKGIKQDDLKIVEGIGPKIEKLLNAEEIKTWTDLAGTDPSRIKEILLAAGPRYNIHDPGSWPKQSALAAAHKWDELKKLKDSLKGGREK